MVALNIDLCHPPSIFFVLYFYAKRNGRYNVCNWLLSTFELNLPKSQTPSCANCKGQLFGRPRNCRACSEKAGGKLLCHTCSMFKKCDVCILTCMNNDCGPWNHIHNKWFLKTFTQILTLVQLAHAILRRFHRQLSPAHILTQAHVSIVMTLWLAHQILPKRFHLTPLIHTQVRNVCQLSLTL